MAKFKILITCFFFPAALFLILGQSENTTNGENPDWSAPVKIDSQWAFYWNLKNNAHPQHPDAIFHLPAPWSINHTDTKSAYIGTESYKTTITLVGSHPKKLHLSTSRIGLAHKVLINGELLYEIGNVGFTREPTKHEMRPIISPSFDAPENGIIEIEVLVANSGYYRGSIGEAIYIGSYDTLINKKHQQQIISSFLSGAILLMGLYHLGLWTSRKKDLASLSFGMFCLAMSIRLTLTGEQIVGDIFPSLSLNVRLLAELGTLFLGLPALHYFTHHLFPEISSKKLLHLTSLTVIMLSTVLLSGNALLASQLLLPFNIYMFGITGYIVYVGIRACLQHQPGSILFLLSQALFLITGLLALLAQCGMVENPNLLTYAVLALIYVQTTILSKRFAYAQEELQRIHWELETIVYNRTTELEGARDSALKMSEENQRLSTKMTTLLEDERQSIAKEIHDHFGSALTGARLQTEAMRHTLSTMHSSPQISQLQECTNKTLSILETCYSSARALSSRLRPEIIEVGGLNKALKELSNTYSSEQLIIHYTEPHEHNASMDIPQNKDHQLAIYRITQEAIQNTIKHARATKINITLNPEPSTIIEIWDNGQGLKNHHDGGSGIAYMRERATSMSASFHLHSDNEGTRITIKTPTLN